MVRTYLPKAERLDLLSDGVLLELGVELGELLVGAEELLDVGHGVVHQSLQGRRGPVADGVRLGADALREPRHAADVQEEATLFLAEGGLTARLLEGWWREYRGGEHAWRDI